MGFMNKRGRSSKHPQKKIRQMKHWQGLERRKLDQEVRRHRREEKKKRDEKVKREGKCREDDVMHASCGSASALLCSAPSLQEVIPLLLSI